jgi:hypothetical protein
LVKNDAVWFDVMIFNADPVPSANTPPSVWTTRWNVSWIFWPIKL